MIVKSLSTKLRVFSVVLAMLVAATTSRGQQIASLDIATLDIASADLPDAPLGERRPFSSRAVVQPGTLAAPEHQDPQTKRIMGIFPNFRAVSADTHLPPQTTKDKFITATEDSFDYSSFVLPIVLAGEQELANDTPEFGKGVLGYSRYLWHSFADQTSENYMVEFIVPTLTREDTRYYTLGPKHASGWKRVGYSLSRVVVTRNDAGKDTFNISEVFGAGAAAGLSNLYYPSKERTFSNTADKWGVNVGVDAASFMVREFWPDINHFLFHGHAGETPKTQ
jgi:hypothetical protein